FDLNAARFTPLLSAVMPVVIVTSSSSFFFSSRRRHTRCYRDWSSDVCSSDLLTVPGATKNSSSSHRHPIARPRRVRPSVRSNVSSRASDSPQTQAPCRRPREEVDRSCQSHEQQGGGPEIGRASCRERERN